MSGIHVESKGGDVLSKGGWGDYNEVSPSKKYFDLGHEFFIKSSISCDTNSSLLQSLGLHDSTAKIEPATFLTRLHDS